VILGRDLDAQTLLLEKGCQGCHIVRGLGAGGIGGTFAPPLGGEEFIARRRAVLFDRKYAEAVRALDAQDDDPDRRRARQAVLAARGLERVRLWTQYQIRMPGFDNPASQMPYLGVSEREGRVIADFLMAGVERGQRFRFWRQADRAQARFGVALLLAAFAGGAVAMVLAQTLIRAARRREGRS
jgi:hypothetical protein